jgi:hypothetical protein
MTKKTANEMTQSAVRLPQSLHERLKKAGGERGMGEEIRRRLEASFDTEKALANPKTRELLDAISFFAEETARDFGNWSEDAFAFEVLKACVNKVLAHYQPKGEPVPNPKPDGLVGILFEGNPSVEDMSRHLVFTWLRDRPKRAFADKEKHR